MNYKPIQPTTLKLEGKELSSIYTPELNTLVDVFKKYDHELRVAGGAVRYGAGYLHRPVGVNKR